MAYHFAGPLVQVGLFLNKARCFAEMGEFRAAREALEEARELSKKLERPNDAAAVLMVDAEISRREWEAGNLPQIRQAASQIEQAIHLLRGTHWFFDLGNALRLPPGLHFPATSPNKPWPTQPKLLQLFEKQPQGPEGYEYVHVCALWANGQEEKAESYLEQAYQRVMQVASHIQDDNLRGSWLEKVYLNRQIIRDWALYHI